MTFSVGLGQYDIPKPTQSCTTKTTRKAQSNTNLDVDFILSLSYERIVCASEDMQTCLEVHFSGYLLIPGAPLSRQGIINYTVYPLSVVHQLFFKSFDMKIPAVVEQSTSSRAMSVFDDLIIMTPQAR